MVNASMYSSEYKYRLPRVPVLFLINERTPYSANTNESMNLPHSPLSRSDPAPSAHPAPLTRAEAAITSRTGSPRRLGLIGVCAVWQVLSVTEPVARVKPSAWLGPAGASDASPGSHMVGRYGEAAPGQVVGTELAGAAVLHRGL